MRRSGVGVIEAGSSGYTFHLAAEGDVTNSGRDDASSIKKTARLAGLMYLLMSIIMVFGFMYAPGAFIVNGDASATARRIIEGEQMYRITILASLVGQILFIVVALTLYQLFKDVDRWLARLMAVLVCVGVAADLVVVANRMAPLDLLIGNHFLTVFTRPQLEALALGFLYLGGNLSVLLTAFWGIWLIPFGILTIKSGFFPKILGVLLMLAGIGYMVTCLAFFVAHAQMSLIRRVMTPLYFGELPIIIWLLVVGAKVPSDGAHPRIAAVH
jgi:uncharacterized protein DUF4386